VGGGGGGGGGFGAYIFACVDNGVIYAIDATRWRAAAASCAIDATRVDGGLPGSSSQDARGADETKRVIPAQHTDVVAVDEALGGVPLVRAPCGMFVGLPCCLGIPDLRLVVT